MDEPEFAAWFRLAHTPGVSRRAARALLAAFGSAEGVLAASPAQWRAVTHAPVAQALGERGDAGQAERWDRARAWQDGGDNRHVIALGDARYPAPLLRSEDPPLLLYVQGTLAALGALQGPCLSIVGSRQATPEGLANARAFARECSAAGWPVVSGLAVGIDAAAHEGALEGPSPTVAVVGTGLDIVYPRRHQALAARIAAKGLLLSDFAPGTPALAEHFPMRNRIIATLSAGTLVVEAAPQSGSLITARLAAEAGREVFAIPGSIHSPQSRGCHALVRQGAKLVETWDDVLDELLTGPPGTRPAGPGFSARAARKADPPAGEDVDGSAAHADGASGEDVDDNDGLLRALGHGPVTMDALAARTGLPVDRLGARLLELELQQQVARLPGGLFQRQHRA
jgi:DNA processing protein